MEILFFLIALEVIGLLAYPLALTLAGNLRDSGYSLARPIGIIIVSIVAWLLSFMRLVPLTAGVYIGLLALAALAAFIVYRHRRVLEPDWDVLVQEAIFIATFLLAALFLMQKPEIFFASSEDFMNSAFLQSILRTDFLPLSDPWFAGTSLPYYYLGHLAAAVLIVLSGVPAAAGYNLAVAAFFAIGVQVAFGIGLNLTERRLYGFTAAFITMVSGFPAGFVQLLAYLSGTDILGFHTFPGSFSAWLSSFDFTAATWTIPQSITIYPFYTFLQGDLHAHFVSIPFLLTLVGLCLALSRKFSWTTFSAALVVTAFLAGMNVWNLPASLVLLALTAFIATKKKAFLSIIGLAGCIFAAMLLTGMAGIVDPGQRTDLSGFLLIFAVFAFISFAYLVGSHKFSRRDIPMAATVIVVAIIAFVLNFPLAIVALLALPFFYRAWVGGEYPALLAGIAMLLIVFCEIFFINDPYGPPFERMNTLMKLYLQAWVFWGVASAYFLFRIGNRILVAGAIVLIAIAAIHPVGTLVSMPRAEYMGTTGPLTLDGTAWLKEQKPDDYDALCWLRETAKSGDVVLEAPGDAYTYSSRVPVFTGLPTVIGWRTHEAMWGRTWQEIDQRSADVDRMYTGSPQELFAKYNVRYMFAGETEREKYGSGLENLAIRGELKLVYRSGNTRVYQVT
jgi:YYY domain-containing protein